MDLLLVLLGLVVVITNSCGIELKSGISKRSFPLIFERGAATTILVALAVPADLENENVYVALNYAANYANPQSATHLTQPLNRLKQKNKRSIAKEGSRGQTIDQRDKIISRASFYKFLINKFNTFYVGKGKLCLLRTICEMNSSPEFFVNNGVLGNLLQVLFSPSLSTREHKFPEIFYEAESKGKDDHCQEFKNTCPHSVLDMISQIS